MSIYNEYRAEIRVSLNVPQFIAFSQALLIYAQRIIPLFQQGIKSIKYARVAEIRILEDHPLTFNYGLHKN
jgi:hypothetical protein